MSNPYIATLEDQNNIHVYPVTKVNALYNKNNTKVDSVTGLLKGDGSGNINRAIPNEDYETPNHVSSLLSEKQDNLPTAVLDGFLHINATTGNLEWKLLSIYDGSVV